MAAGFPGPLGAFRGPPVGLSALQIARFAAYRREWTGRPAALGCGRVRSGAVGETCYSRGFTGGSGAGTNLRSGTRPVPVSETAGGGSASLAGTSPWPGWDSNPGPTDYESARSSYKRPDLRATSAPWDRRWDRSSGPGRIRTCVSPVMSRVL